MRRVRSKFVAKNTHSISHDYVCPKCRGHRSDVREVAMAKTGLLDLLPSRDNRYLEVTCVLCGYTEFYNRAIYLASLETKTEDEKLPLLSQSRKERKDGEQTVRGIRT